MFSSVHFEQRVRISKCRWGVKFEFKFKQHHSMRLRWQCRLGLRNPSPNICRCRKHRGDRQRDDIRLHFRQPSWHRRPKDTSEFLIWVLNFQFSFPHQHFYMASEGRARKSLAWDFLLSGLNWEEEEEWREKLWRAGGRNHGAYC